jgi:predicted nucleic acid-binding protein
VIDIYRGYPPAVAWLSKNQELRLAITPFVWMETVIGAENKGRQKQLITLLGRFKMVYPVQADIDWTMRQLERFYLSHSVGFVDCLIAAPAHRLSLPLYTRNLKHMLPLLGAGVVQPY